MHKRFILVLALLGMMLTQPALADRRDAASLGRAAMVAHRLAAAKQSDQLNRLAKQVADRYLDQGKLAKLDVNSLRAMATVFQTARDQPSARTLGQAWHTRFTAQPNDNAAQLANEGQVLASLLVFAEMQPQAKQVADLLQTRLFTSTAKEPVSLAMSNLVGLADVAEAINHAGLKQATSKRLAVYQELSDPKANPLAPAELAQLAQRYQKAKQTANFDALAAFIVNRYLPAPGLADVLQPTDWLTLTGIVMQTKDITTRAAMAATLDRELAAGRLRVDRMRRHEAVQLAGMADALRPAHQTISLGDQLMLSWLKVPGDAVLGEGVRNVLADQARQPKPTLDELNKELLAEQQSLATCATLAQAMQRLGQSEAADQWARWALNAVQDKPTAQDMYQVADVVALTKLKLSETEVAQLVTATAALDEADSYIGDPVYRSLGKLFKDGAHREVLKRQLMPKPTQVNLHLARVLAWVHRYTRDNSRDLVGYLHHTLSQRQKPGSTLPGVKGDDLARWHLVMADCSALLSKRGINPTYGMNSRNQALAAAKSDVMRLQVVLSLVDAHRRSGQFNQAKQIIASMTQTFSPSDQQRLAKLSATLAEEAATHATKQQTDAIAKDHRRFWQDAFRKSQRQQRREMAMRR